LVEAKEKEGAVIHRCEFCNKELSKEKGEEDHGCLDCAGSIYLIYTDKGKEERCMHCIDIELAALREFKQKSLEVIGWYGDEINWMQLIDGRYNLGKIWESVGSIGITTENGKRARQFLNKHREKL
jgi:hypothetical protein